MFKEFEICEEPQKNLDDLCTGCPMNDDEIEECDQDEDSELT